MDVFETVKTMLAVRDYADQPIAEDSLNRILEAGRLTASRKNLQPWHFVVVRDRVLLAELASLAPSGDYIHQAALAIAVFLENDRPVTMTDGARAVQSMMLVAWGEGIGSNWVGWLKREEIKGLLGAPADHHLLTVLSFGYPARKIGLGKKNRKALHEIAHTERYGKPFFT
jgi:nitroreductase